MPPRPVWWIAALFVATSAAFFSIALATAASEEQFRKQPESERWLFQKGRFEVGVQIGGGLTLQEGTRSANLFAVMPRFGYVFAELERGLPGSFEVVVQPSYLAVFQENFANVWGIAPLLKYNVRTGTRFTPFVEAGAGVSYATTHVPPRGSHVNFILQTGLGLQYTLGDRHLLSFQWLYHHLSNADLGVHNSGLNTSLFLLGFSTLY